MHPVNETVREDQKLKERLVTQPAHVSSHDSSFGNSILDRQEDPRTGTQ